MCFNFFVLKLFHFLLSKNERLCFEKKEFLFSFFPILSSNQKIFRPSEDDVKVLRTELVNAQKLMDEISKGKDVEIQEHIDTIRKLNIEREKWTYFYFELKRNINSDFTALSKI